ncbi:hypothetical protein HDV00_000404 [Rhizophlyctis rosea]|nr:hypothetical protein HDV00_000404 [Rhizophlyctis rosea]
MELRPRLCRRTYNPTTTTGPQTRQRRKKLKSTDPQPSTSPSGSTPLAIIKKRLKLHTTILLPPTIPQIHHHPLVPLALRTLPPKSSQCALLGVPPEILYDIIGYLSERDVLRFGSCGRGAKGVARGDAGVFMWWREEWRRRCVVEGRREGMMKGFVGTKFAGCECGLRVACRVLRFEREGGRKVRGCDAKRGVDGVRRDGGDVEEGKEEIPIDPITTLLTHYNITTTIDWTLPGPTMILHSLLSELPNSPSITAPTNILADLAMYPSDILPLLTPTRLTHHALASATKHLQRAVRGDVAMHLQQIWRPVLTTLFDPDNMEMTETSLAVLKDLVEKNIYLFLCREQYDITPEVLLLSHPTPDYKTLSKLLKGEHTSLPSTPNPTLHSIVETACTNREWRIARRLLESGVNMSPPPDMSPTESTTPLLLAIEHLQPLLVTRLLTAHCPSPNTALQTLIKGLRMGDYAVPEEISTALRIARSLISHGARAGCEDLMMFACFFGCVKTVRSLIDAGCRVTGGVNGDLCHASAGGRVEVVRMLVERGGADVGRVGGVAMRTAIGRGHGGVAMYLAVECGLSGEL